MLSPTVFLYKPGGFQAACESSAGYALEVQDYFQFNMVWLAAR